MLDLPYWKSPKQNRTRSDNYFFIEAFNSCRGYCSPKMVNGSGIKQGNEDLSCV